MGDLRVRFVDKTAVTGMTNTGVKGFAPKGIHVNLFLSSGESDFINGKVLVVNGGRVQWK